MSGILILGFLFVLRTNLYNTLDGGETREDSEDFLRNHPYNQREKLTPAEWKKRLPKKDRPDLAWEHDFLMTMDPATKTVPKERLFEAYEYAEELRATMPVDRETNWTEHGPNNVGGRTRAIMFDPNDATNKKFWAGSVSGGLWYTDDITASSPTWVSVNGFWENIAITTMAYDPSNTYVFYVGTGEGWNNSDAVRGAGIWKTTDGGASWTRFFIDSPHFYYIQKIIVHPSNGEVFAATDGPGAYGGIFKSEDGGYNWNSSLQIDNTSNRATDLELDTDGNIYAAMSTDGIYKSTDIGANWDKVNTGSNGFPTDDFNRLEIATAPSNANVVYAVGSGGSGDDDIGVFVKSNDGGSNWTSVTIPLNWDNVHFTRGQAWYDLILAVAPDNENILYAGGIDLHKSTDSGTTWTMLSAWHTYYANEYDLEFVHADQHSFASRPGYPNTVVFGNDGGLYMTTNAGANFTAKNSGYNVTQFYSCALHPDAGEYYFLAGSQDNGTQQFSDADSIVSTYEVTGGDGAYCFIDQTDPNYQITSYVYNNYYLSTDDGNDFQSITNDNSGRFINPADYDNEADILYSAKNEFSLKRIMDVTGSYYEDSLEIELGSLASHIRVSDFSYNTIFVGSGMGRLLKVLDAHGTNPLISDITGDDFPNGYISCIELGDSENQILVTFSNYGVTSVWETINGGSSWENKEGNLPDMPVRWAVYNPNNYNEVLLATELGVWNSIDFNASTPTWSPSNTGLANVRTDMFQIRADNLVAAATHGRGLFTSDGFQRIPDWRRRICIELSN